VLLKCDAVHLVDMFVVSIDYKADTCHLELCASLCRNVYSRFSFYGAVVVSSLR
jgi:hypothetical protein